MNTQNTYFLLRHGETPYQLKNEKRHYPWPESGDSPVSLTERGKRQIKGVAQRLKQDNIDLLFSSDITRARQTAEIISRELDLKLNFDKRLRDINYGIYQGRARKEFSGKFPNAMERFHTAPKNGESWLDCKKRIEDFVKEVEKRYEGKKILIVSHGDPLWLFEGILKNKSNEKLLEEKLKQKLVKAGELRKIET